MGGERLHLDYSRIWNTVSRLAHVASLILGHFTPFMCVCGEGGGTQRSTDTNSFFLSSHHQMRKFPQQPFLDRSEAQVSIWNGSETRNPRPMLLGLLPGLVCCQATLFISALVLSLLQMTFLRSDPNITGGVSAEPGNRKLNDIKYRGSGL